MSLPKYTPLAALRSDLLQKELSQMTTKEISVQKDDQYLTISFDNKDLVLPLTTRMNYLGLVEALKEKSFL